MLGTEDDIDGFVASWGDPPVPKSILKIEPEKKKSMTTRIKEGFSGLFGGN